MFLIVDEKSGRGYHRITAVIKQRYLGVNMAKHKGRKEKNVETAAESIYAFFRYLLDLCICVYLLLILVVMPFYNEEGYAHIGTDKSTFFRKCTIYGGRLLLPILLLAVIMWLVVQIQKKERTAKGKGDISHVSISQAVAACRKHLSATDMFAVIYGISVIFSYIGSDYQEEALWGATGWFMGLIPQLTVIAVYFLVSRAWKGRGWMAALALPVSAVVFILGYLNRFGIYPIDMQMELPSFISTIGNINWYCGYLVSVFFGGMYLFWRADGWKTWQQLLLAAYVIVGYATLATQGSSSGIFTMAVMFLVFFGMSAPKGERMERFWLAMLLFSLTCTVTLCLRAAGVLVATYPDTMIDLFTLSALPLFMTIVSVAFFIWVHSCNQKGHYPQKTFTWLTRLAGGGFLVLLGIFALLLVINTASGGTILKMTPASLQAAMTFSPTWGSNRGATWTAGWLCFWEQNFLHKLIGVGPDCMSAFIYNDGSSELVGMVRECFGEARLTNAHNEWLTILVNMGLLGLIGFAGMMLTAIRRFLSCQEMNPVAGACGICLLAYTINNMFSFQQSMSVATIFVILGMGENAVRAARKEHT